MTILIYAVHDNNSLSEHTAKTLTAAQKIGLDIDLLICGNNIMSICQQAAKLKGIRKVLYAEADYLQQQLAEPIAQTIQKYAEHYKYFLAPANTDGKNIMPRLAALLDVMQISNVIEIIHPNCFKRPIYAGNALATLETEDEKKVITIQTAAFTPTEFCDKEAPIEKIVPAPNPKLASFDSELKEKKERPDLNNAKIIVAGGRGLGSKENFQNILMPFADKLNAAIGASRSAVDADYAPNDWQIGQTGKIVAPDLYIAVGISGAIQHIAGMKDSKVVVAINKDPEAPILKVADYAIIGDLFTIIPEFEKALDACKK